MIRHLSSPFSGVIRIIEYLFLLAFPFLHPSYHNNFNIYIKNVRPFIKFAQPC